GSLKARVTAIGESTALAGIMRLVAEAQASRSRAQVLADRAASLLTFVAITAGVITFIAWIAVGRGLGFSIERTVAVLVIACPHALGLAIPLVVAISTSISARNGLLVRDRRALEAARAIDIVLFDKTGTLTRGEPAVREVISLDGVSERDLLTLAASVEAESEPAFSRAIVASANEAGLAPRKVDHFSAVPGKGVRGEIEGELVEVGNRGYFAGKLDGKVSEKVSRAEEAETVVFVARRGEIVGAISLADEVRPESKEAVAELRRLGVRVAMVTGDNRAVAGALASQGIPPTPAAGAILRSPTSSIVAATAQLLPGLTLSGT